MDGFWSSLSEEQIRGVESVAMDMWDPYINSTLNHLPEARGKIVFDKFHIAKHLSEAVDLVRRRENKQLRAAGDDRLTGTRYDWLRHPAKMEPADRREFAVLRDSNLKTARAWALKESMMAFFRYFYQRPARKHFRWWPHRATRSRLRPMIEKALMIQTPLREHRYLSEASHYQRRQRVHQFEDSMGRVHGSRFPKQNQLHRRHLFPLRRTGSHAFCPLKYRNARKTGLCYPRGRIFPLFRTLVLLNQLASDHCELQLQHGVSILA
jgi:transposase